ncbi:MAG: DUF502 domain-containing protein [Proteobacteria bacterium]|nr:DUF502 domain-containing protein [Pseudomonadota bacterium]
MIKFLKNKFKFYLVIGIATFIPIYVTILIIFKIISFFDDIMLRLLSPFNFPNLLEFLKYPGVGIILSIIFFVILGFFSRRYLGKKLLQIIEKIFLLFPIARQLYLAVKKLAESIMDNDKNQFKRVVMVPFPHENVRAIGFLTGRAPDTMEGKKQSYVYVPTAINPTSGFMIVVKDEDIIDSELTVDEAFALILSGGMANKKK